MIFSGEPASNSVYHGALIIKWRQRNVKLTYAQQWEEEKGEESLCFHWILSSSLWHVQTLGASDDIHWKQNKYDNDILTKHGT